MQSFYWDDNFVTGLSEVDNQHFKLVSLINQFGSQLAANEIDTKSLSSLHQELVDYAVYHFHEEEELMRSANLAEDYIIHHIQSHRAFLDEVTSIFTNVSAGNIAQASAFLEFLTHWLAYHILGEDKQMAGQIEAIKSGIAPDKAYIQIKQQRDGAMEPLLKALNGLFEQVSKRNRELKQLNESLEEKVAQRTKALMEANQHLEELSLTDVLTGVPNRRHAMRRLATLWQESIENNADLSCIMIDADYFKEVNDTYGHNAGDNVLIELSKTLKHGMRSDDIVCRLGGDEFLVICPATCLSGAIHIAESIRQKVAALEVATGGQPWLGSISVGVATHNDEMLNYDELMKAADKAVYQAKKAGRNCVKSMT